MAIETYVRKPRGQKHPITKYRVRIRTTVDALMAEAEDARLPYIVDELYDTLGEAKQAEERHWLSVRTGAASKELAAKLRRLAEPTMAQLLKCYADAVISKRAESSREVEKVRLEKTIPEVRPKLGRDAEKRLFPGTPIENERGPFGKVLVSECDKNVILAWIKERSKSVAPATVRRELGLISAAMDRFNDYFIDEPKIENPCKELNPEDRPELPLHRERVLSPGEEKILLSLADVLKNPDLALAIRIALGTAMRRSDILGLDWGHINWDTDTIRIPEDKTSRARKRRKGRAAVMLPIARFALSARWNSLGSPAAGKVIGLNLLAFRSAWKRLQDKLADDHQITGFTFHDLRHTVITRAAASGWSPVQVSKAFAVSDIEHLEKRHFSHKPAVSAAKGLREGRQLTMEELAAIGGHADHAMVARYANQRPEDMTRTDRAPEGSGSTAKLVVRKEGGEYVASVGDIEVRAMTASEAVKMARELTA